MDLGLLAIAAAPAFVASTVEFVEATTVVLAVGVTRGWRAPLVGAALAAAVLAVVVALLGVTLVSVVPDGILKLVVGTLLVMFGLRWLRKAILRFAGIIAIHDEEVLYQKRLAALRAEGRASDRFDWSGMIISFKTVLLEGTEVAFIVITLGSTGPQALEHAIVGAAAAGVLVTVMAAILRHPLSAVPENTMKFVVGVMLSAFGVFWFGEGSGADWPGDAAALLPLVASFLAASWVALRMLKRLVPGGVEVKAKYV